MSVKEVLRETLLKTDKEGTKQNICYETNGLFRVKYKGGCME